MGLSKSPFPYRNVWLQELDQKHLLHFQELDSLSYPLLSYMYVFKGKRFHMVLIYLKHTLSLEKGQGGFSTQGHEAALYLRAIFERFLLKDHGLPTRIQAIWCFVKNAGPLFNLFGPTFFHNVTCDTIKSFSYDGVLTEPAAAGKIPKWWEGSQQ